jgi:hypothetical protein
MPSFSLRPSSARAEAVCRKGFHGKITDSHQAPCNYTGNMEMVWYTSTMKQTVAFAWVGTFGYKTFLRSRVPGRNLRHSAFLSRSWYLAILFKPVNLNQRKIASFQVIGLVSVARKVPPTRDAFPFLPFPAINKTLTKAVDPQKRFEPHLGKLLGRGEGLPIWPSGADFTACHPLMTRTAAIQRWISACF